MLLLKKIILIISLSAGNFFATAQLKDSEGITAKDNIIKLNVSSLAVKNIALQYERRISKKTSAALSLHLRPFGNVPFKSTIKKIIDNPYTNIDELKLGNFGITPEFRFYPGKKGALRGFYIGTFLSYNSYKTDVPITYENGTKTGIFSGKLRAYTAGIQLGAQWKLNNSLTLDWWILGPNYGGGSGDVVLVSPLSYTEQVTLKYELEQLKNDVPLNVIKSYAVDGNGATIILKGPWAGLRGLGFNLGYRF
jgi:Protein of unknown function (DUF3575)